MKHFEEIFFGFMVCAMVVIFSMMGLFIWGEFVVPWLNRTLAVLGG